MTDPIAKAREVLDRTVHGGSLRYTITEPGSFDDGPGRCRIECVPVDDPECAFIVSDDCDDSTGRSIVDIFNDAPAVIRSLLARLDELTRPVADVEELIGSLESFAYDHGSIDEARMRAGYGVVPAPARSAARAALLARLRADAARLATAERERDEARRIVEEACVEIELAASFSEKGCDAEHLHDRAERLRAALTKEPTRG